MRALGPVLLLALALLAAFAFLADRRAKGQRDAALAEQALTLAGAVSGAALEAQHALEAAEGHLVARLAAAARRAETLLQRADAPTQDLLERVAREERVGRVALVAPDASVVALARHPAPLPESGEEARALRARADASERDELAAAARSLAPAPGQVAAEGLALQRLATRERFGLAYGRPAGGWLVLRADADEVVSLRRRFGLAPVLEQVGAQPGVAHVRLLDAEGTVLLSVPPVAADTRVAPPEGGWPDAPAAREGPEGMRALKAFALPDGGALRVDLALSTQRADEVLGASRRVLWLGLALAAVALAAVAAWFAAREARRRRAEREAALQREEEARLAQMGALAALVTHEVSNPLNAIRLGLTVLSSAPAAQQPDVLASLQGEAARMGRTLESFLGLARAPHGAGGPVGPEVLERVRERVAGQAAARQVRVAVEVAPLAPRARADAVVLEQALANLARNAIEATPPGGSVRLAWGAAEDGGARVHVDDAGPGFPKDDRAALLQVGATGPRARAGGHGLGLPLADRFVRQQGGRMLLLDAPGGGARVELRLAPLSGPGVGGSRG